MTSYSGTCEGGPYHGKPIYHGKPEVNVAIQKGKVVTYFGPATEEIKIGRYRHEKDRWVWQEP